MTVDSALSVMFAVCAVFCVGVVAGVVLGAHIERWADYRRTEADARQRAADCDNWHFV